MSASSDFGATMRYTERIERSLFLTIRTYWLYLDHARILDIGQIAYAHLNGMYNDFAISVACCVISQNRSIHQHRRHGERFD
jgi:hypothetical protein